MKLWIKQHQDTLRYANEINSIIAILVVKSTIAVALNMIICGLVIVRSTYFPNISPFQSKNFIELIKFFTLTIFSVLRFVICSSVADTMSENANGIAWKIYDSPWTYSSPRIRRMALLIIARCQKPVAIHATGFLSSWNLKFCAQVLYTNATYLMTLRVVIRE
ncbi:uncharacterized protein LOC105664055 [Megachile rotundata]|uniref:uncharacterized protein LOC105664055 n=1 Tax=Megachile rotundata TaxID=143995 RepID=UPI003FD43F7C